MVLANKRKKSGFTIPEVVIALTIAGALVVPLAIISVYFISSIFDRSAEATLTTEAQAVLRTISEDLRNSNSILPQTSKNDPSYGIWTTDLSGGTLVFNSIALDTNRQIMTIGPGDVTLNEFVYFTDGNKIYKRSLPFNSGSDSLTQRTCPAASAGPSCLADPELTSHLSKLTFTLYDDTGNITTDPSSASSVLANVSLSKNSIKGKITVEKDIRVTLRRLK